VIDYPAPGIPYYYALVYEEDLSAGIAALRPGGNASTGPVEIPDSSRAVPSRTMPLPRLNISGSEASAPEPEPARNRDRAASSPERRGRTMEAAVFPEDLQSGAAGEDYQLRSIVQGYFSLHEWDRAEEELKRFLALPRKGQNQAKARFYLGQIYYFRGNSREALFEFLEAREKYPVEANPWIQAVLDSFTR
jgi:TolA-binding protein